MFLTHDMVVLPFPRSTFFNFIDIPLCFPFQEKRKLTTWKKKDMDRQKQLNNWKETSSFFKRNIPPHEVFELFLTNEEMEKNFLESTKYARLKGEHNFIMFFWTN